MSGDHGSEETGGLPEVVQRRPGIDAFGAGKFGISGGGRLSGSSREGQREGILDFERVGRLSLCKSRS